MKKVLILGLAWLVMAGVLQAATPAMDPAGEQGSTIEMARPCSPTYDVTVVDDYSYPQFFDRDYGLGGADIELSNDHPAPGETVTITANVHNYGLCKASSAWGSYDPTGRSCWGEWDFDYPAPATVDISYRCWDDDATVYWRVELDGVHIADVSVPQSATGESFKLVTIQDVPIYPTTDGGPHTIFLGTYQMYFYPDYHVDWVEVGDVHIEAETYDRMGGNDATLDWRGLTTSPRCPRCPDPSPFPELTVQIWNGDPSSGGTLLCEECVGESQEVIDYDLCWPDEPTYVAHYIENYGQAPLMCDWTPAECGAHEIYVVVDPGYPDDDALVEIDETNNVAQRTVVSLYMLELDIKPGSCPNSFNRDSNGVLPVALVGTEEWDMADVDISTLRLARADGIGGEVAPHEGPPGPHTVYDDVATPFYGEGCECHEAESDGIMDIMMHFETELVVEALEMGGLPPGSLVELVVTGNLNNGCPLVAYDCVRLVPPGAPPGLLTVTSDPSSGTWVDAEPLDLTLDGGGFADFERVYPLTTVVTLRAQERLGHLRLAGWLVDGVLQTRDSALYLTITEDAATATVVYEPATSDHAGPTESIGRIAP